LQKIETGLKIYIRGARPSDIKSILVIYSHHVTHSAAVPENQPVTEAQMTRRMTDIRGFKLPYLVALKRGATVPGGGKKRQPPIILPDEIVGFAFADLQHDDKGMYRFNAELEVYVDNHFYMKGIASCLMDKMLGLLDPTTYAERGGYGIEGDEAEGVGTPMKIIKHLLINMSYDRGEVAEWKQRWILGWMGFEQKAQFEDLGIKNGNKYDTPTPDMRTKLIS